MPESKLEHLQRLLGTAADALHDAAWVMSGEARPAPPLPDPIDIVLPQTKRVEGEIRAALSALDEGGADVAALNEKREAVERAERLERVREAAQEVANRMDGFAVRKLQQALALLAEQEKEQP